MLKDFVSNCVYRLRESQRMIQKSLEFIEEEDLWNSANEQLNSIGNILLHLTGNIGQYGVSALGGRPDHRVRDQEFIPNQNFKKSALFQKLVEVIDHTIEIAENLQEDDWTKLRKVQGFEFTGIGILLHVVEHLSYHTGQIAFLVKLSKNKPLGFYDGFDLNLANEN